MHLFEAFHRSLKVVYLEGKQSQRLDHLLSTILKVARDKEFEQLQKLHKGKVTHRSSEIYRRHKKAEEMINNGIEPVVLSATTREVQSQSNSSIALWSSCKVITSVFANWYVHLAKCVYMCIHARALIMPYTAQHASTCTWCIWLQKGPPAVQCSSPKRSA